MLPSRTALLAGLAILCACKSPTAPPVPPFDSAGAGVLPAATSFAPLRSQSVAACGATLSLPDTFRPGKAEGDLEHLHLDTADGASLVVSCLPKGSSGPGLLGAHAAWVMGKLAKGIPDDRVKVTRVTEPAQIDGHPALVVDLEVQGAEARTEVAFTERAQIFEWIRYTAPAGSWEARGKERTDLFASFRVTDPSLDQGPTRWWHPAIQEAPRPFAEARAAFNTKVSKGRPAKGFDGEAAPMPPKGTFAKVDVLGPQGRLTAYVTPDPKDGKKHPVVVWAHGGFGGIDDWFWDPAPRSNDQSARAFREAGIVLVAGSWRAENDNPGDYELFYGEVDDLLAIRDYAAKLAYVDPGRVYLAGHSSGGTLVLLAAEKSDAFRAAFSIGGAPVFDHPETYARYGGVPFDASDATETLLRSSAPFVKSIRRPTFYFEGGGSGSAGSAQWMADRAALEGIPFQAFLDVRASHFSILAPVTELIAKKILADTGPAADLHFTQEEIDGLALVEE